LLDKTDRVNDEALKVINNRSNLETGDILFSGTGTVGRIAVIQDPPKNWNIKEGVYVIKPSCELVNSKYIAHLLNSQKIVQEYSKKIVGSPVMSIPMRELKKLQIPIPCPDNPKKSLAEQERIVSILDNFDALVNDISIGLPAEITARRQQYEHYRNQLLTFKEV
jgi:type I restriction enzyme S subunit